VSVLSYACVDIYLDLGCYSIAVTEPLLADSLGSFLKVVQLSAESIPVHCQMESTTYLHYTVTVMRKIEHLNNSTVFCVLW
jgi:hypothetical protein